MLTYRVKANDTLSGIANKHNTTVEALVASNGIKDPDKIYVGQVLKIYTTSVNNNNVYNLLVSCLDAIEQLPEFKQLEEMLHG